MMSAAIRVGRRLLCLTGSVLAIATLSACSEGPELAFLKPNSAEGGAEVLRSANTTTKLVERDVEAPDVFSSTESGLWDGRPSLGGVWVAHPDVTDPERVIIRNESNGKFVIGALFRRERDIPGPRLQASSDAAAALGMLAGAPVRLNVTALRREEVAPEPDTAAGTAEADTRIVAAVPAATGVAETTLDPIAGAAAAIASSPAPKQRPAETVAEAVPELTETEAEAMSETELAAAEAAIDRPAKKSWFGAKLFGRKKDTVGAPLSALNPEPVTVAAAAPVSATPLGTAPTNPTPVSAPKAKASPLKKPYLQIGIFSIESNAGNAADQMRRAGIVPTIYEQSTNGKTFWRVVVGPAQSTSEQSALLTKIKSVGFSDAYAVTN